MPNQTYAIEKIKEKLIYNERLLETATIDEVNIVVTQFRYFNKLVEDLLPFLEKEDK